MYLIYRPAEGEEQRYQFDMNSIPNIDAEAIERVTDWTLGEWQQKIQKGSVLALRALLWVLQRRVHQTLKFTSVTFSTDQVTAEPEPDELIAARDAALEDGDITETERAQVLAAIYEQMDKIGVEHDAKPPKARASKSASPTS